jgi:hypothetical protein
MEPAVKAFLKRIALSVFLCILWAAGNIMLGIKFNFAFPDKQIAKANVLYYVFLIATTFAFVYVLYKIWRKPLHFDE